MVVIGLTGKQRVGKDTVASYLVLRYGYERIGNADYLKKVAGLVGWSGKKDQQGRKLLQELGMVVRNYDQGFWIRVVTKFIEKVWKKDDSVCFVIPDVRFPNEAEAIKELGGIVVRVQRDTGIVDNHASETEMDEYPVSAVLDNNTGFDDLYAKVDALFAKAETLVKR